MGENGISKNYCKVFAPLCHFSPLFVIVERYAADHCQWPVTGPFTFPLSEFTPADTIQSSELSVSSGAAVLRADICKLLNRFRESFVRIRKSGAHVTLLTVTMRAVYLCRLCYSSVVTAVLLRCFNNFCAAASLAELMDETTSEPNRYFLLIILDREFFFAS